MKLNSYNKQNCNVWSTKCSELTSYLLSSEDCVSNARWNKHGTARMNEINLMLTLTNHISHLPGINWVLYWTIGTLSRLGNRKIKSNNKQTHKRTKKLKVEKHSVWLAENSRFVFQWMSCLFEKAPRRAIIKLSNICCEAHSMVALIKKPFNPKTAHQLRTVSFQGNFHSICTRFKFQHFFERKAIQKAVQMPVPLFSLKRQRWK